MKTTTAVAAARDTPGPARRPTGPADGTAVATGFGGAPLTPLHQRSADAIIADYGFLVDAVLRRLPPPALHGRVADIDDLRQEGLIALLDAARTYNPAAGAAFPTYARVCVLNAIRMVLRKLDVVPSQVRRDLRTVRAAEDRLAQTGDSVDALPATTGLTVSQIRHARHWQHLATTVELDESSPASHPSPEQAVLAAEEARELRAAIAALPERHRRVLLSRLVHETPVRTLAAAEGLSPARISQLTTSAIQALEQIVRPTP